MPGPERSDLDRPEPAQPGVPSPTRLPIWVTGPMSRMYAWEAGRRSRRFDRGVGVERIDRPVISVGNLSAGGTGKSPVVRWVVRLLQEHGYRPAIAMRGYKAEPGQPSDEQAEHAGALPGVPIVARPDRIAGLRALFETDEGRGVDCVVLDDGFQHRRLARDLDIVLIDATRPPDRDALLPRGFLREPIDALGRADAVVITRSGLVGADELRRVVDSIAPSISEGVPIVAAAEEWGSVACHRAGGDGRAEPEIVEAGSLRGKRLVVCCAIGNPDAFVRFAQQRGVEVVGSVVLGDHASYGAGEVERVVRAAGDGACDGVLTTGKDWVKLSRVWAGDARPAVYVPAIAICVNNICSDNVKNDGF